MREIVSKRIGLRLCKTAGVTLFNDIAIFHIDDAACRFAGHFDFMGDDNLSDIGLRQLANNADNLRGDCLLYTSDAADE